MPYGGTENSKILTLDGALTVRQSHKQTNRPAVYKSCSAQLSEHSRKTAETVQTLNQARQIQGVWDYHTTKCRDEFLSQSDTKYSKLFRGFEMKLRTCVFVVLWLFE